MRVINERPPMWEQIDAAFKIGRNPIIFCWGQAIYNPNGGKVTRELIAHEEIHAERQGPFEAGIKAWWEQYLVDPAFRLEEELPAHRAEYKAFCKRHGSSTGRARYLGIVASRLCGPLYGSLLDLGTARDRIILP